MPGRRLFLNRLGPTGPAVAGWLGLTCRIFPYGFVPGHDAWLHHGEVSSMVFDRIGRFGPIEVRTVP